MNEDVAFIQEQVDKHHGWFSESLPLIASENLISPLAREMLLSDFQDRYAEGLPGERYYQGNLYVDAVETRVTELAKRLFRCSHADVRPISGTNANLAVLFALAEPGDTIRSVELREGAHISTAKFGAVGVRGCKTVTYPFNRRDMNLDIDGTIKVLREVKPKVALFGQSVFLFPTPLEALRDALDEVGCPAWYDAAHVLGLIAGGTFQDPFREGADVITGSTHKTLPGPQHGILLAEPRHENIAKKPPPRRLPRRRQQPSPARDGRARRHACGAPRVRTHLRGPGGAERPRARAGAVRTRRPRGVRAPRVHALACAGGGRRGARRRRGRGASPRAREHHREQEPHAGRHIPRAPLRHPAREPGAHAAWNEGVEHGGGRRARRARRRHQGGSRRGRAGRRLAPARFPDDPVLLSCRGLRAWTVSDGGSGLGSQSASVRIAP